jgi:hypothetical protein
MMDVFHEELLLRRRASHRPFVRQSQICSANFKCFLEPKIFYYKWQTNSSLFMGKPRSQHF